MSDQPAIVLAWQINGSTGWGLYGLHLAIQLKKIGRRVFSGSQPDLTNVPRPLHALLPQATDSLPPENERMVVVSALGNSFDAPLTLNIPHPVYHVGLTVFEDTALTPQHVENLKQYDRLIAPSQWCADILAGYGLDATVCHQGFDVSIFHPAPRVRAPIHTNGWDGRVLVFSGGKLEYRKGQDIAIAAFRLFRETPEGQNAVLVTAWHNPWPATMEGIWNAGHFKGVPKVTHGQLELGPWLAQNGVPPEAHLDLGQMTQLEAAAAIRECDVAIFPNRCEGATNMVLSECLGLGVPCIAGQWTGHADLLAATVAPDRPATTPPKRMFRGTDGWHDMAPETLARKMGAPYFLSYKAPATWAEAAPRFNDLLTIPTLALVDA